MQWTPLDLVALLLALTAAFAYFNHYVIRLPRNSGLLVMALALSVLLRLVELLLPGLQLGEVLQQTLDRLDFPALLLHGFLGFLLFSAAVNIDVDALRRRAGTILTLATVGVLMSTLAVGAAMWEISRWLGLGIPLLDCFAFGALISPTDPITVTDVLRRVSVPERLQALIAGESLFNDGVGIVLYSTFIAATQGGSISPAHAALDVLREGGGGALLGLAAGALAFFAIRGIDEYRIELIISLALVTGTYGLAESLGVSGPVAVVVAGLIMGSIGVQYAVSGTTHDYLQKFWSLTDELLNALLFLVIGLEFAAIRLSWKFAGATALAILITLLVRAFSVTAAGLPLNLDAPRKLRAIALLTWSGLRGGVSVALALSLPESPYRDALLTACYGVVLFTMLGQGLTLRRVAARLYPSEEKR